MTEFNQDKFKLLLNEAIGQSFKADFSKLSGISRQHLSRMLNGKVVGVPTKDTLKKIAKASFGRVRLEDLYSACGYSWNIEDLNLGVIEFCTTEEKVMYYCRTTRDNVNDVIKHLKGWKDFDCFVYYMKSRFSVYGSTLNIVKKDEKYVDPSSVGAENYSIISIKYDVGEAIIELYFIVTYSYTKKNKMVLIDSYFDGSKFKELNEVASVIKQKQNDEVINLNKYSFVYNFYNNIDLIENYNSYTSLDYNTLKYIALYSGLGFYTKNLNDSKYKTFFIKHKDVFILNKEYRELYYNSFCDNDVDLNKLQNFINKENNTKGLYSAIAYVIEKETGFPFKYYSDPNGINIKYNEPCVFIEFNNIRTNKQKLESIVRKYAKELGSNSFGTCYFQELNKLEIKTKYIV